MNWAGAPIQLRTSADYLRLMARSDRSYKGQADGHADPSPGMSALQATHRAHQLWCRDGIGVATCTFGVYEVGTVDGAYGRSLLSFEDAFINALGGAPRD